MSNYVGIFEKVSYDQFEKDFKATYGNYNREAYPQNEEEYNKSIRAIYDGIFLPSRGTASSAGYDFHIPMGICIGEQPITIPTGIRCRMEESAVLIIAPRSSHGFKYGLRLVNTIAIVDADYYNADNEGHIMLRFKADKPFSVNAGDKFFQGILLEYGLSVNGNTKAERTGGIGSTGN